MTDDDPDSLTRADIDELAAKLDLLPDLEREMAIALTGTTRPGGPGVRRPAPSSRPPDPIHIEELLAALHATLLATVRAIERDRGAVYDSGASITAVGAWLLRYRFALQLMASGVELRDQLVAIIDRCSRAMNHVEPEYVYSEARVKKANRKVVTGPQVEKLAYKLGDCGRGLNRKRVTYLRRRGLLAGWRDSTPIGGVEPEWKYRLGDVLAAHQKARSYKQSGQGRTVG